MTFNRPLWWWNLIQRRYTPGKNPQKHSGLGLPIGEQCYIVRVFYGTPNCYESLEGPFVSFEKASEFWREMDEKGYGALVLWCTNVTAAAMMIRK